MKSRRLVPIVAFALLAGFSHAQWNHAWSRFVDGPTHQSEGSAKTVVDASGAIYSLGSTALDGNTTGADFLIVKFSPTGDRLWTKTFDGPGHSQDIAADMIEKDGWLYICGRVSQPTNWYGDSDFCTIKMRASDGEIVWTRYHSGEFTPGIESSVDGASAIAVDHLGNVFVSGSTWEWGYYFPNADFCTVKYDSNGNQLWTRKYHGGANYVAISDAVFAIEVDPAGDLIVTGDSPGPNNASDVATIKYRGSDGAQLWVRRAGETEHALMGVPASLRIGADGDAYVLIKSFNDGTAVIRYANDDGSVQWWWNAFPGHFGLKGAFQLASNGDPVLALIYDPDSDDSNLNNNLRVVRLAKDTGTVVFNSTNGNAVHGDYQAPRAMAALPDGSVLVVGHGSPVPWARAPQLWQFDATGQLDWTALHTSETINLETRQVVLDPFGAIVVGGQADLATPTRDLAILKFTPPEEFAPPVQMSPLSGFVLGGSLSDVYFSDDLRASLMASDDNELAFVFVSQSQFGSATSVRLKLESRATRPDLVLIAKAKVASTGQWETLTSRIAPMAESLWEIAVPGSPNRVIDPATHQISTRFDWVPGAELDAADGWGAAVDQIECIVVRSP